MVQRPDRLRNQADGLSDRAGRLIDSVESFNDSNEGVMLDAVAGLRQNFAVENGVPDACHQLFSIT